jgi:hypothetical protein
MTTEERLARLEKVVTVMVEWVKATLGTVAATKLMGMMEEEGLLDSQQTPPLEPEPEPEPAKPAPKRRAKRRTT